MKQIVGFFVDRGILIHLLTGFFFLGGIWALARTQREAFPNIDFDTVTVTAIYPGAGPEDVEKLITNPIEKAIKEVDGIKEYRSASIQSRSGIVIVLDPDARGKERIIESIRSAVDRVESLPDKAEKPIVLELTTERQPVLEVTLSIPGTQVHDVASYGKLRAQAYALEKRLEQLKGVARIQRRGWRAAEIQVEVDPERFLRQEVGFEQILNALKEKNVDLPGGVVEFGGRETIVRTSGAFDLAAEVSRVFVRSNDIGLGSRVGDVARVRDGFARPDILDRTNGQTSISLIVLKHRRADIVSLVGAVRADIEVFRKAAPPDLKVVAVNDLSFFVKRRLRVLTANALQGFVLVFLSLFFFLGWRPAALTALGIPFAVAVTFLLMPALGITLNLISMFGLILVVGMLVDDAIVICDNVYRHYEEGRPLKEAVVHGTSEVVAPVLAAVLTTVFSFAPLLFATGIFGKFLYSIPVVVILALSVSLVEAFFILPAHIFEAEHGPDRRRRALLQQGGGRTGASPPQTTETTSSAWRQRLHRILRSVQGSRVPSSTGLKEESPWFHRFREQVYEPFITKVLNRPVPVVGIFLAVLIVTVVLQITLGRFKLFPSAIDAFIVKVTAPPGVSKDEAARYVEAIEYEILRLPPHELENTTSRIGIAQKDPNDPYTRRGSRYAQVIAFLTPEVGRKRKTDEIMRVMKARTAYLLTDEARARLAKEEGIVPDESKIRPIEYRPLGGRLISLAIDKIAGGPPVGKPVAVQLMGDDLAQLEKMATEYAGILRAIPGVQDVTTDAEDASDEIRLRVNEAVASQAGVSVARVASVVYAAVDGAVATTIRRADEEVDVRVRFQERGYNAQQVLNRVHILNGTGNLVPLTVLASYEQVKGRAVISHFNGRRLLTVTANVDEKTISSAGANIELGRRAVQIPGRFPGTSVRLGGEFQDTQESLSSLGIAFVAGILLNFILLAGLFRSLVQPLVVLAAVPMSFVGVMIAFLLHQEPLSFLSIMGVVGLAGVVVNDSIVLVDYANQLRRENPTADLKALLVRAASTRLRAVLLTTITTVLGLLPTAYGLGGFDPFLVPMALAFAWGLAFATSLTLVLVPVLYFVAMRRTHEREIETGRFIGGREDE